VPEILSVVIASDSEAIQFSHYKTLARFVAYAPLRKRLAFVAGNDRIAMKYPRNLPQQGNLP
jgi:hypothetical protein